MNVPGRVIKVIQDTFDYHHETIELEQDLVQDLGADSLDLVDLAMSLEEEFDIEIGDESVDTVKTVQEVIQLVESLSRESVMRARKKTVEIECFRWNGQDPILDKDGADWPVWFWEAWHRGDILLIEGTQHLLIKTLEGDHRADIGDWLIQGVKGELYPCKPDIFELTYEIVDVVDLSESMENVVDEPADESIYSEELERGRTIAMMTVEHLHRMGDADSCTIPITVEHGSYRVQLKVTRQDQIDTEGVLNSAADPQA